MRNLLIGILVFNLILGIFSGCEKQCLPVPEYPLTLNTVEGVLQDCGYSCTIEEDNMMPEGRSQYNLFSDDNGWVVAGVSSAKRAGDRILSITFPPFYAHNSIPSEKFEDPIVFATLLFGGFESSHQVYVSFIQEYDTINTEKVQFEKLEHYIETRRDAESYWKSNIGGIDCKILLEQPRLNDPQEYLRTITFTSNWDTFYTE